MKREDMLLVMEDSASSWQEAIRLTAANLQKNGFVEETFADACIEREKVYPTGLPFEIGVAIPHTDSCHVKRDGICLLRLKDAVEFSSMEEPDEKVAAKMVLNLAVKDSNDQLSTLMKLMRMLSDGAFLQQCCKLSTDELKVVFASKLF